MPDAIPHPCPPRVVLEITPPSEPRPEILLRRASALLPLVRAVNVIHRNDRWSSLEAAAALRTHGFDPVWHLPNRGRTLEQIETELERAAEAGVRRILCIRGEYKATEASDEPKIREVVRRARQLLPQASIGVTLNHYGPLDRALPNLWRKLEAGADLVQTQVCFDLATLRPIATSAARRFPGVAILPMLLPVLSDASARRASRRLGIPLDQALHHALEREGAAAGWRALTDQLAEVAGSAVYAGVALMTPIDPTPAYAHRLREAVQASGLLPEDSTA